MNKRKKRHPLACKCCTYDGGGDPSGKYAVRNDPAAGGEGDNCAYPCDFGSHSSGAPGRFHPGRSVRYLFYGEQHDGAYPAILCVFTVYEHDRDFRSRKGSVDFRWMPDLNRFFCRMALDFTVKM